MKQLKISNKGLIEIGALSLLGACTKRNNTDKIGMFGSGNKYAIACFLRNNINIKIFSGKTEIKVSTITKEFAQQKFNVICFNDKETSITTETGPQWKIWQAIREIYCNAIDESEASISIVEDIIGEEDKTNFYIDLTNEVLEIYDNIKDYFAIDKKVLFENKTGQILEKHSINTCVYRKGIKVYNTDLNSIFDYNIFNLDITEDRINKYSWEPLQKIHELLLACTDKSVIRKYLSTSKNTEYIEGRFQDSYLEYCEPSKEFKEVLGNTTIFNIGASGYLKESERLNTIFVEDKLYKHLLNSCPSDITVPTSVCNIKSKCSYIITEVTPLQLSILNAVLKFFDECKFNIKYDIEIVSFFSNDIHGSIDEERKKILVSENAFIQGKQWVASTIIEEQCHLSTSASDETRNMQNALIDMFLTYLKERNAYNL